MTTSISIREQIGVALFDLLDIARNTREPLAPAASVYIDNIESLISKLQQEDAIDKYTECLLFARKNNQTVGEKNDYYITLQQLENILSQPQNKEESTKQEPKP